MDPNIEAANDRLTLQTLSQLRLEGLVEQLTQRVMVVNDDALTHLVDRGVLAPVAAAGCCKPDGGTCCPNRRLRLEPPVGPGPEG